ncbi:hypothetical protein BJ741DRAFT_176958 [Chytriomyces cf. hyalinus JEL632]|nr:hypothetical protein BJ741DRAFT_176958 [Chytriomyces cf. hyalinus JEL632]
MSPESAISNESVVAEIPASAPKPARMSMLQPLSKTVTSMVNSAGGYLGVGKLGEPAGRSAPTSFEAIQKEMEETRRKANEEAKRLEEEEEKLAAAMMKERENKALRAEFEKNAKQAISQMVKGERTSMAPGQAGFTRASLLFSANSTPRILDDTNSFSSDALAKSMGSVQEESEGEYELDEETGENQELPPKEESDVEPNPVSPIIIVTPTFSINDGADFESTVTENKVMAATVDEEIPTTLEEDIAVPEDKDISATADPAEDEITVPEDDEITTPEDDEITAEDNDITAPEDDVVSTRFEDEIPAPEEEDMYTPESKEIASLDEDRIAAAPVEAEIIAPEEEEIAAPEDEEITAPKEDEIIAPEEDEVIAPEDEEIAVSEVDELTAPEDDEIIAADVAPEENEIIALEEEEISTLDQEDLFSLQSKVNAVDDFHAVTTRQISDIAIHDEAEIRSVVQEGTHKSLDILSSDSSSIPPASLKAVIIEGVIIMDGNHESGCYSYSCRNGIETGGASCYSISHLQEDTDELNPIIVRNPTLEVVKQIAIQKSPETLITPALSVVDAPEKLAAVTPGSSCYSYQCQHESAGYSESCYSIGHVLALEGHYEAIRVLNPESAPISSNIKDAEAVKGLDAKIPVTAREVNHTPLTANAPGADDVFATATYAAPSVPILSKISETESKAIAETVIQEFSDSLAEEDILTELGIEISSAQEITVEETTSLLSESEVIAELGALPSDEEIVIEQPYTVEADTSKQASYELDVFLEPKLEETVNQAADGSDLMKSRDSVLNSLQASALYEDMFSSAGFSDEQIDLAETTALSADLSKYSLSPEFGSMALPGDSELDLEPSDPVKDFEAAIYGDDSSDRNEDNFDQTELYGGETTSSSESLAFDAANEVSRS